MAVKVSGGESTTIAEPGGSVMVKDRYEIHPSRPLPLFDSQPAVAYACDHTRDGTRSLFALICDPKIPPRLDLVSGMRRIDHRNLLRALDYAVVDWGLEGRRCPAIIMERPGGGRVFNSLDETYPPLQEEILTRHFIEPVSHILRDMHAMDSYHRMVRPDNLFRLAIDSPEIALGECYSSQPGLTNPVVYETLECAMSSVAGRGAGGEENDLFALGVTILALLTGRSPLAGMSDDDVIALRHKSGTYAAYVQNQRLSLTMMEPLRGLLNDDPDTRWTSEELSLWLDGRRLSPKQQSMPTKGARALRIGGTNNLTAREVARALQNNWDQAERIISDGELDTWIRRSLGEDDVVEAVNIAKIGGLDNPDKLIARVIIALDPDGPIRLREFSATLDGISSLIGAFANDPSARKLFAAVLGMSLMSFWADQQRQLHPEHIKHISRVDRVRTVLPQSGLGFGIERVIYELNEDYPCLSEMFERDYVHLVEQVLPAYERVCVAGDPPNRLIDRHVAAFLGTHFKRPLGTEFRECEQPPDSHDGIIAEVRILVSLQDAMHRNDEFPALCDYEARKLEPTIDRFYSRERRKKTLMRLQKAARSGRLVDLLNIVEDANELNYDQQCFDHASNEYTKATVSLIQLTREMYNKEELADDMGGQLAGATSLLLSIVVIGFTSVFALF